MSKKRAFKEPAAFSAAAGGRFRTNATFHRTTGGMQFRGRIVRQHPPITGCWVCEFDGIPGATQYVHESHMEAEDG